MLRKNQIKRNLNYSGGKKMFKNAKKSWVTTITGAVIGLVAIGAATGIITPEQKTVLTEQLPVIISSIGSIVLIFYAKDSNK